MYPPHTHACTHTGWMEGHTHSTGSGLGGAGLPGCVCVCVCVAGQRNALAHAWLSRHNGQALSHCREIPL